jgi:hypothetical protein
MGAKGIGGFGLFHRGNLPRIAFPKKKFLIVTMRRFKYKPVVKSIVCIIIVVAAILTVLLWARSSELSKASVQAILDSVDKALLEKDAAAVVANYASNAVITATIVERGTSSTTHYESSKDYGNVLKDSFGAFSDYTITRTNVAINISLGGKTAEATSTIIETFTLGGNAEKSITHESTTLEVINGKVVITKEHDDVKVD